MTNPPSEGADSVLRAMTDDGAFRVIVVQSTETVRAVIAAQEVEGQAAVQLAQTITSALLVRETMAPAYRVQVLLRDQHGHTIVGDAFPEGGRTRGLAKVEDLVLGVRLDEGGFIQVMRSLPGRAPHQGVVDIDDVHDVDRALTAYFQRSEQVESMVGVASVLRDGSIAVAAGYVVQLLPELTAPPLDAMHARLRDYGPLAPRLAADGGDPSRILAALLAGTAYTMLAEAPVRFGCACDVTKAIGAVAALGEEEVRELLDAGKSIDITCEYCRVAYRVGPDDFRGILDTAQ